MNRLPMVLISVLGATLAATPASFAQGTPPAQAQAKKPASPAIFDGRPLDDLIALTKGTDKVLIVKGTAEWCGPCKQMDRTTWVDKGVIDWFKDNGFATTVDVDHQPELAQRLRISAMPTMIAFRDGQEFDRVVGYQSAPDMLKFGAAVKRGESSLTRLRREAGSRGEDGKKVNIQKRIDLAYALIEQRRFEEGTDELLWLWDNMLKHEPAMVGVRQSFFVQNLQQAADGHEPFASTLRQRRAILEEHLKAGTGTWSTLEDWYALSEALRDEEGILAWFDRIKVKEDSGPTLRRFADRLTPLLQMRERWADVGRLVTDPARSAADLRRTHEATMRMLNSPLGLGGSTPEQREESVQFMMGMHRQQAGLSFAGLLAAGRGEDAAIFAREVMERAPADDDERARKVAASNGALRVALVDRALEIGQGVRENAAMLRAMLDEAAKEGADVAKARAALDEAIEKPAQPAPKAAPAKE